MFRTFGERLKDIEIFYEKKDYNNVVVETAKLMEHALGYLFMNFHRTLRTPEDRLKFLEFEKQNDEKYSAFIKKPTIGVALGFYNSLLKYIPEHQWLHTDLKSAINSVNVIRNTQVHAGKKAVTDSEAGEVIDAAELFLKKTEIYDLPLEDVGFPLKYYLVYTSIQEKFRKGETESDFRKIINDSVKLIPDLMNSLFNKIYPFLSIEYKEKLNRLHPGTLDAKSKEFSLKHFIEIFDEIELFDQMEEGANLRKSLLAISDESAEKFSRRTTRHHVNILEVIFNYIHNKKLDFYLDYAGLVKKKYLEDNQINDTDRIILADRAKDLGLSDAVAGTIETTVVRTIEKELILFQTLHEDPVKEKAEGSISGQEQEVSGRKRKIKKSYLFAGTGAVLLVAFAAIYFLWIKSDFPAYERAFLKGQQEKFVQKSKKARSLKEVRANALYIWGSYENNNQFMPDEIVQEYRGLLQEHPESPEAHFYLGEAYYFAHFNRNTYGLMDSAWILINKSRDMGLKHFDVDNMRRVLYEFLGITPLVIEGADDLVRDYPDNPDAWHLTGDIYLFTIYDTIKAIEFYRKSIEICPYYLDGYSSLAGVYTAQGEYALALDMLERALKVNPDNSAIAWRYNNLFIRSGRFNEAAGFFEEIIRKNKLKQVAFYRVLAELYVMQYDTVKARKFIESSLEKFPGDIELKYTLDELRSITRLAEEDPDQLMNQKIDWLENFDEALAIAGKEGKPILAEFCDHKNNYWSRWMNREVYSDSSVQELLSFYIPVRFDEIMDPEIFKKYDIDNAYYDLKIISSDGVKLEDLPDYIEYPNSFLPILKRGLQKYYRYQLGKKLNTETFNEVSNLEAARLISEAKGFPIMVLVANENSSYSRKLLNETLTDPVFISEFNNIVYLHLSPDRNQELVKTWNIRIFPTILFFNKNGKKIHEVYGYKTPENLATMVRKVKESCARGESYEPEINWLFNLEEAKAAALAEQKNIFMCSKYLRNDTIRMGDPEVIRKLGKFICFSVEDLQDPDLITRYGYLYRYSCYILDPSGNDLFKSISLNNREKFLKWLGTDEEMNKMLLIGPERYEHFRSQIELAEAMTYYMPRSSISVYTSLLEAFPEDVEILREIGNQYLILKEPGEAIKYLNRAFQTGSDDDEELLGKLIDAHLSLGNESGLKAWFNDQIRLNEGSNSVQATLFRSYSALSEILMDSIHAIEYALRAIELNPGDYMSHLHLGKLLYRYGEYSRAKSHLDLASRDRELSAVAHLFLALIADRQNQMGEKQRYLEIAVNRSPTYYYSLLPRMNRPLYHYPGFIDLIFQGFSDVKMIVNDIYFNSAYSEYIADFGEDLELALSMVNESIRKEPESWYFYETKAWVLYRMGQFDEADKFISRFMQNEGDQNIESRLPSVYHIGKIKMAIGDTVQGLEYLRKAGKFRDVDVPWRFEFILDDVNAILNSLTVSAE